MNIQRRIAAVGLSAAAVVAASIVGAAPANAGSAWPGVTACYEYGGYYTGFCLFYNSDYEGAYFNYQGNVPDLAGYKFNHSGYPGSAGLGQYVKNNAASAYNLSDACIKIFYNHDYSGPSDVILPNSGLAKLSATYNEDASIEYFPPIDC